MSMQIFVKNVSGKTACLDVQATETVANVKAMVGSECDRLIFSGKTLHNSATLADSMVANNSSLFMISNLDGGAKRKKKVYTKPKKNKHRNKKVKLRILSLYKIEGDVITRLRKECPRCGSGYFMANHPDRYYCGKCHTTIVRE